MALWHGLPRASSKKACSVVSRILPRALERDHLDLALFRLLTRMCSSYRDIVVVLAGS